MTAATPDTNHKTVTDYLSSLVWDGVPRLDRWLIDYAGADDSPHSRSAGRMTLVAAVRRARHPGCRFDQLPVIVGPQGCCKSSALRLLAVDAAWFTDIVPITDADTRRIIEATAGKWIVEASELEDMLRASGRAAIRALAEGDDEEEGDEDDDEEDEEDDERDENDDDDEEDELPPAASLKLKAFLSRTHDEARLAYQREVSRVPRNFVVVGTTSQTDFLVDPTGNRRIVPVHVQHFDLDRLREVRDQLWAEAAVVEAAGQPIQPPAVAAS
jgi:predicted P-loop ATPase